MNKYELFPYDEFIKTDPVVLDDLIFFGMPVFTTEPDRLFVKQHFRSPVTAVMSRYRDIEITRKWLESERYEEADRWIAYIESLHKSVKDNGFFLDRPIVLNGDLTIEDGDHRMGAAIANGVMPSCIMPERPYDLREICPHRTAMPVSTGYSSWRSYENRYAIMRSIDWTNKNVLDLGCNTGLACYQAKELGAAKVYGIDSDPDCIMQAKGNGFCFICHDLSLGFAIGAKIDIVIMNSIVAWVNSDRFYSSLKRQITPTTKVLLEAHHDSLNDKIYERIKKLLPNAELLGYTDYKRGSKERRAVYMMSKGETND